jgi:hypothetical protein
LGATGAAAHDPLAPQIHQASVLGELARGSSWKFLQGAGGTEATAGASGPGAVSAHTLVVQGGNSYSQQFNVAAGDKLDLTQVLAGAPLAHDLTNLNQFIKVVSHGTVDQATGGGTKTALEVTGPAGKATVNLVGSGQLDLKDLLQHSSLILPPH